MPKKDRYKNLGTKPEPLKNRRTFSIEMSGDMYATLLKESADATVQAGRRVSVGEIMRIVYASHVEAVSK